MIGPKREEELHIFWSLSGVQEVKYDLDRTGKNDKKQQIFKHWNVPLDALPGSATIGPRCLVTSGSRPKCGL